MNVLNIAVSLLFLLVIAEFNDAHGLTSTLGKPSTPEIKVSSAKPCENQSICSLNKNTTCLNSLCLCGDNHPPNNGVCLAELRGPNHICVKSEDCVDNADCVPIMTVNKTKALEQLFKNPNVSICKCQEGYAEVGARCGGGTNLGTVPLLVVAVTIFKIFN